MSDGAKCDFCDSPAIAVGGETNGLLLCGVHVSIDRPGLAPGHGGNAGLCTFDHTCPSCEAGRPLAECVDLFEHPACGLVACCADEAA